MLLLDAFLSFARRSPEASTFWLSKLLGIDSDQISAILESVPDERMSPVCKQFTLELLKENRRRLLEAELLK